ncbi:hypothetical protein BU23DRAFT_592395 [Bimuria novae-zelandiae CBS 107.79]|uniref:CCHC-type domain-containing protein n=1 Tax=Bimuria novae-zelandiae CBS 107.79 TaxID=1447943 RepID=A0A6A5UV35_9PLEO|nr:hypothetical protein BU23DRAFT_592395 [Bimuria novae-zelandiae CBS 107.79]
MDISASEGHDLEAAFADLSGKRHERLDWQHSVVDLLKLLDLDYGVQFRGWLADTLDVRAGPVGSAKQNNALRKAIIKELAAAEIAWTEMRDARFRNGQCLNCGHPRHWEHRCQARCGKCLHFSHTVSQCGYPVRCIGCGHIGHMLRDCQGLE